MPVTAFERRSASGVVYWETPDGMRTREFPAPGVEVTRTPVVSDHGQVRWTRWVWVMRWDSSRARVFGPVHAITKVGGNYAHAFSACRSPFHGPFYLVSDDGALPLDQDGRPILPAVFFVCKGCLAVAALNDPNNASIV